MPRLYRTQNLQRQKLRANRAKAVKMLEQRGYQVHDVDADSRRGQPVLEVEAFKDGREYNIVLSYPDLKIIKERIDY